jgi:flagellar hook-associated protein 3 FlgL
LTWWSTASATDSPPSDPPHAHLVQLHFRKHRPPDPVARLAAVQAAESGRDGAADLSARGRPECGRPRARPPVAAAPAGPVRQQCRPRARTQPDLLLRPAGDQKVSDRATEIGTLGGGVISPAEAKAHASELDQLIEQSLQLLNTKLGNDYIYAGNRVDQPPFVATRDAAGRITAVNYAGENATATIPLSASTAVSPTTDGVTNRGLGDFVNHLVALRDALNQNDTPAVSAAQSGLITTEDGIVNALAEAGGVQARIEASRSQQQDMATTIESLISREADADLPSTIVKLNQTQTAYQAALQSSASIMKISLLDYIR